MDNVITVLACLSMLVALANFGDWIVRRRGWPLLSPPGWLGVLINIWVVMMLADVIITLPWLRRIEDYLGMLLAIPLWSAYSIVQRRRVAASRSVSPLTAQFKVGPSRARALD